MTMLDQLEKLENLVAGGRVPGTSRCLVNVDKFMGVLEEIRGELPEEIREAQGVIRQKEGIIKQAELEARRIRAYADDEATTIRQMAEEQSTSALESAREQAHSMIQETEVDKFLFVAEDRNGGWIARRRAVITGQIQSHRVEILSGLEDGEYIVTLGFQNLADGQKLAVAEGN